MGIASAHETSGLTIAPPVALVEPVKVADWDQLTDRTPVAGFVDGIDLVVVRWGRQAQRAVGPLSTSRRLVGRWACRWFQPGVWCARVGLPDGHRLRVRLAVADYMDASVDG
jgi:hypothetical protein